MFLRNLRNSIFVNMIMDAGQSRKLFLLLQRGVILKTRIGCSIHDFLAEALKVPPETIEQQIQTVFLNGKTIDDLSSAFLRDGSTLSLSGALPGLMGATLRRGGYYASMRQSITFKEETPLQNMTEGVITLKVFNLLLPEIGPLVFSKGFWIKGRELQPFLNDQTVRFSEVVSVVNPDGDVLTDENSIRQTTANPNGLFFVQGR